MLARLALGALVATTLVVSHGEHAAFADEPPPPPAAAPAAPAPSAPPAPSAAAPSASPATPAPPVPPPPAPPVGAVVVAASDGAGPAAWSLAFDVYRDTDLRPTFDDATARVLAGNAPAEGASARLKELAELRVSIAHAGSELVARRLLGSLATELNAVMVIAVTLDGTRPVARVLRSGAAAFESIELAPTIERTGPSERTFHWPSAATTLHRFLPGATVAGPLAPKVETTEVPGTPSESKPFYKSPWFWGSAGGAAAIGLAVFLISRSTSTTTDVHLSGKVGP